MLEQLRKEAAIAHRIYIASIHPDLKESDIRAIFEAFGTIRSCKLIPYVDVSLEWYFLIAGTIPPQGLWLH